MLGGIVFLRTAGQAEDYGIPESGKISSEDEVGLYIPPLCFRRADPSMFADLV